MTVAQWGGFSFLATQLAPLSVATHSRIGVDLDARTRPIPPQQYRCPGPSPVLGWARRNPGPFTFLAGLGLC